jgi:hypothetical protein
MDKAKLVRSLRAKSGAARRVSKRMLDGGATIAGLQKWGEAMAYADAAKAASRLDEPAPCPLAEGWRDAGKPCPCGSSEGENTRAVWWTGGAWWEDRTQGERWYVVAQETKDGAYIKVDANEVGEESARHLAAAIHAANEQAAVWRAKREAQKQKEADDGQA